MDIQMKILLLGKNGQVGWELQRALLPLGDVLCLGRQIDAASGYQGNIADFTAIDHVVNEYAPDIIVNAAAYTAVDKAETDREQADLINHLAVKHLADLARRNDALLIHYSTDYVFSGEGVNAWSESDVVAPQNTYGQTKLAGEVALDQSGCKFINFRTSWVYGTYGNNFIKTMLKLAQLKEELNIINDQVGVPTGATLIADVTAQVLRFYQLSSSGVNQLHGHYHLAPRGETTWYDYARLIFSQAEKNGVKLALKNVGAIPTSAYPTPAKRPLNSRLNIEKIQNTFQLRLPMWQIGVEHVLGELCNESN